MYGQSGSWGEGSLERSLLCSHIWRLGWEDSHSWASGASCSPHGGLRAADPVYSGSRVLEQVSQVETGRSCVAFSFFFFFNKTLINLFIFWVFCFLGFFAHAVPHVRS